MGLTQSTQQAEQPTKVEIPAEETKTTNETIVQASVESIEPVSDKIIKQEPETNNPSESYLEKPGTKVEVAPVEVAPSDDVVKKTKKKNKNKNKGKQNE